ncbi:hypothetical protein BD769DRAFT_314244 [Suillus cothurnatus]|nr:hypothetical protein BD769DRAFT_314244 [Suillus cothurnatus]
MSRASADPSIESWFRAIHFSVVIIIVIDSVHYSVVDTGDNAELVIYYEPYNLTRKGLNLLSTVTSSSSLWLNDKIPQRSCEATHCRPARGTYRAVRHPRNSQRKRYSRGPGSVDLLDLLLYLDACKCTSYGFLAFGAPTERLQMILGMCASIA